MTLPSAPTQISLGEIQSEFGGINQIAISEYYRNPSDDVTNSSYVKTKLPGSGPATGGNNPNTVNIPTSGQISLNQFRESYSLLGFNRYLSTIYNNNSLHFYTAAPAGEILGAPNYYTLEPGGENYFYIHGGPVFPNATALHRFFNSNVGNGVGGPHLFTTDFSEGSNAGFAYENIVGYVYTYQAPNTQPVYRGFNSSSGDFFYSKSQSEINNAAGYQYNGVAFYAFTSTNWW